MVRALEQWGEGDLGRDKSVRGSQGEPCAALESPAFDLERESWSWLRPQRERNAGNVAGVFQGMMCRQKVSKVGMIPEPVRDVTRNEKVRCPFGHGVVDLVSDTEQVGRRIFTVSRIEQGKVARGVVGAIEGPCAADNIDHLGWGIEAIASSLELYGGQVIRATIFHKRDHRVTTTLPRVR